MASTGPTAAAHHISPPGVTRTERLNNIAQETGPGSAAPAQGLAFIDGNSLGDATQL
jgi:hypothetical protein